MGVEVIEDLVPIHNTQVSLQVTGAVKRVYLAPQMEDIDYKIDQGRLEFAVDAFTCHQMVVVES